MKSILLNHVERCLVAQDVRTDLALQHFLRGNLFNFHDFPSMNGELPFLDSRFSLWILPLFQISRILFSTYEFHKMVVNWECRFRNLLENMTFRPLWACYVWRVGSFLSLNHTNRIQLISVKRFVNGILTVLKNRLVPPESPNLTSWLCHLPSFKARVGWQSRGSGILRGALLLYVHLTGEKASIKPQMTKTWQFLRNTQIEMRSPWNHWVEEPNHGDFCCKMSLKVTAQQNLPWSLVSSAFEKVFPPLRYMMFIWDIQVLLSHWTCGCFRNTVQRANVSVGHTLLGTIYI